MRVATRGGSLSVLALAVALSGCYEGRDGGVGEAGSDTDGPSAEADGANSGGDGRASAGSAGDDAGTGGIDDGTAGDDGLVSGGEDGVIDDVPTGNVHGPLAPRLTDEQYGFTVLDLLGVELTQVERDRLPRDLPAEGRYSSGVEGQFFNSQYVLAYANVSRSLTERIDVEALVSRYGACTMGEEGCLDEFIDGFGLRAFRRPLDGQELTTYAELAQTILEFDGASTEDAFVGVTQAMLQSPHFLYRIETETDGAVDEIRSVNGYEIASRLSYFLWQSAPDEELLSFAAGPNGDGRYRLADLPAQVERMMADPRFARGRRTFWGDYTIASIAPFDSVDPEVGGQLRESLLATLDHMSGTEGDPQPLTAMFDTQTFVMTPAVAELAGLEPLGDGLQVYDVSDIDERIGILTHPGFVAAIGTTSFVGRGVFMTERFLCRAVPSPPDDPETFERIAQTQTETSNLTPREASEFRFNQEAVCQGCHRVFEPIAYAFEPYDQAGRYGLVDDQGRDLFSDGVLPGSGTAPEIAFSDAPELLRAMGDLEVTRECLVENMMEFATGYHAAEAEDSLLLAFDAFEAGDLTFEALVRGVALNQQLTFRRVAAP